MHFQFTPAAERALAAAADWTSCDDCDELHVPEVLLGLVDEPECRAALLLAHYGIDATAVRRRFSTLARSAESDSSRMGRFSAAWLDCLRRAELRLIDYPRPLVLATEHLLLGIAAGENEVSDWLGQCGLNADALENEVHRLCGHESSPLPFDGHDEPDVDTADDANIRPVDKTAGSADQITPQERDTFLRIIDAAANRAGEGLRVIEDYLRFSLDDRHLTTLVKTIRHELTDVLGEFSDIDRHRARDTQADVGTDLTLDSEQIRGSAGDVVAANFKRVEQSLRSLEEFSKAATAPATAAHFEQLRYRVYTLERSVDITRTSLQRLADARLYVLMEGCESIEVFRALAQSLVDAGVSILQLRDKKLADRELLARAKALRQVVESSSTLFLMNDRPDLATLAGADGVHLGQEELTVKDARRIVGPSALVGISTHSLAQARAAVLDGADYIGVGPVFASRTKEFSSLQGVELLASVKAEIRLPAFAIGGITTKNLAQVKATGFSRIAVSAAVTGATDPAAAAAQLVAALDD